MKSLNKLKLEKSGQVSDSSLVALFGGESIGCLESPFIEHEKVAAYSETADHYLRTKTRLGIPTIQIAEGGGPESVEPGNEENIRTGRI